jgi:hypothetical protein
MPRSAAAKTIGAALRTVRRYAVLNAGRPDFGEFVAAYQEQIKRPDFSDRARLDTLRLSILNITLKASDWTSPVQKNLTDIVHSVLPASGGK